MTRKANRDAAAAKPASVETRTSLVDGLKGISNDRWLEFAQIYSPLIRHWICRGKVPPSARDDVLQECLKSLFQGIAHYERRPSSNFRGWLRTIVERRVADYFREEKKDRSSPWEELDQFESRDVPARNGSQPEPEGPGADPGATDLDPGACKAGHEAFARAVEIVRKKMQPQVWQMFWQKAVEKRDTADVAHEFGTTTANVRVAKQRVLKKFRDLCIDPGDLDLKPGNPAD